MEAPTGEGIYVTDEYELQPYNSKRAGDESIWEISTKRHRDLNGSVKNNLDETLEIETPLELSEESERRQAILNVAGFVLDQKIEEREQKPERTLQEIPAVKVFDPYQPEDQSWVKRFPVTSVLLRAADNDKFRYVRSKVTISEGIERKLVAEYSYTEGIVTYDVRVEISDTGKLEINLFGKGGKSIERIKRTITNILLDPQEA